MLKFVLVFSTREHAGSVHPWCPLLLKPVPLWNGVAWGCAENQFWPVRSMFSLKGEYNNIFF